MHALGRVADEDPFSSRRPRPLSSNEFFPVIKQLLAAVHLRLGVDSPQMRVGRALRYAELPSDTLVGSALKRKSENLRLAFRQFCGFDDRGMHGLHGIDSVHDGGKLLEISLGEKEQIRDERC